MEERDNSIKREHLTKSSEMDVNLHLIKKEREREKGSEFGHVKDMVSPTLRERERERERESERRRRVKEKNKLKSSVVNLVRSPIPVGSSLRKFPDKESSSKFSIPVTQRDEIELFERFN